MNPRGTLRLLVDPLFGPYFIGKLLSSVGVWAFSMVAAVVMWDLTRSALAVGMLSVATFVPQLVFAPLSGAQADRGDPKIQMVLGRMLQTTGALGLAIPLWGGSPETLPGPWVLVLAAGAFGFGHVVGGPAQHSLVPSMVREVEVPRAVALNALAPIIARGAGPVLGTFLLVSAGAHWAFLVSGLSILTFGVVIMTLPLSGLVDRATGGSHTVRHGISYLRGEPAVAFLLLAMLAVGIGSDPTITLTPALSASLGQGGSLVGTLAAGFGVGAAMAYAVLVPTRQRSGDRRVTALGLGALAGGLCIAGIARSPAVAVTGLGLAGVGFCWSLTGATTRIYALVPQHLRGRIMALWSMAFVGSRPVSAAFSGAVADAASIEAAFLAVGLTVAVLGVFSHFGTRTVTASSPPVV